MAYGVRPSHSHFRKTSKFRHRKPFAHREYNERSFEAFRQDIANERDLLDSFLEDSESPTPCWNTHVIRNFCQTSIPTLPVQCQPEIHLDDRDRKTKQGRDYPELLSPEDLQRHLEVERFGKEGLPNADYRQIRIHNLNPESLLALARTAACHQVDTLRDAFAKHISCATSFRVHERVEGFVVPRLELHLPYLTLREVSSTSCQWKSRDSSEEGEGWLDLPLPESGPDAEQRSNRFLIKKAHVSIVFCVWDYSKWVAYAFSKGGPMHTPGQETDASDEEDSDSEDDALEPKEDIFAPRDVDHGLYGDDPIRDPREYFLRVVDVWIIFILREYMYLVRVLEACVRAWVRMTIPRRSCIF